MGGGGGGAPREGADDVLGFEPIIENKKIFSLLFNVACFFNCEQKTQAPSKNSHY